jgi:hypothetical protein
MQDLSLVVSKLMTQMTLVNEVVKEAFTQSRSLWRQLCRNAVEYI